MDVKLEKTSHQDRTSDPVPPDVRQRRALARLGLAPNAAYVAPTLLALRTVATHEAASRRSVSAG